MNNIIWIILDSCRYDTFLEARTPHFDRIGTVQRRYSYASWTSPSHYTFLMGLMPHQSPQHVFASEVYQQEYHQWQIRIDSMKQVRFKNFLPHFSLVRFLNELGYRTIGRVSLPVLHPNTSISMYFDDYQLMDNHNSFRTIVDAVSFLKNQSTFYFLNLGETHYPYMLDDPSLPHVSGVHGVLQRLDNMKAESKEQEAEDAHYGSSFETEREKSKKRKRKAGVFDAEMMKTLRSQQVKAVEYCDVIFGQLIQKCPENTYYIITSDHGELFGENGYFGHGPIMHEKVFAVPFLEGKI